MCQFNRNKEVHAIYNYKFWGMLMSEKNYEDFKLKWNTDVYI